jgi:type IV pilus assembly protein PilM
MFFNPFPYAIGIDIGDLSIKVVQLINISQRYRKPSYDLITARATQLPHGIIVNGVLEKPETLRKYISHLIHKKTESEKPIKSPWITASLPDNHGFIKLIQIAKEPGDIIEEDIIIASKQHVPFQEDDYYLDWQIMPSGNLNTGQTNVLLSSVPKNIANMYTYLFESLGLVVTALELGSLSAVRSMITASKEYEGEARVVLDIGATNSTITVFDHGHIQFSSSLPYSGEILTKAISQKLNIAYDEAEMKKKAYGLEYTKSKSWPILAELTDQLVAQIEKSLTFYESHFANPNKVTGITMCGGGSALKNLDKILTSKLKINASRGDVWKNLNHPKPIKLDVDKSLRFTKAVGLGLRAADNPFFNNDTV